MAALVRNVSQFAIIRLEREEREKESIAKVMRRRDAEDGASSASVHHHRPPAYLPDLPRSYIYQCTEKHTHTQSVSPVQAHHLTLEATN